MKLGNDYKKHEKYKPSGLSWINDIPQYWGLERLKINFRIRKRIAGTLGFDILSITQRGIRKKDILSGDGQLAMDYSKYQLVEVGDFAMNHMDLLTGFVDIASFKGVTSPDYRVFTLENKQCNSRFWLYIFQHCYKAKIFFPLGRGAAHLGRWRLPAEEFNEFVAPVPPLQEQQKIAQFLDVETAKIDTLMEKQQQLIALLKEKRQAVISHAVTKGLNPDAPMRDSGVEWLGDVPVGWEVKKIWQLYEESSRRAQTVSELANPVLSVSIHHGISDKELSDSELDRKVQRSEDRSLYKVVEENYLVYNMMRAWQGGFGASKISGLVSPAYVVCKPKVEVSSAYFEYCLRMERAIVELKKYSRGITDFRLRLYWDDFRNVQVPVPPMDEVNEIILMIKSADKHNDLLMDKAELQIALLKEKKSALISAAVTGKIDVRDWQPANADSSAENS